MASCSVYLHEDRAMAKVLIVDDDVVLRDFLKPSLSRDGYDVRATGTRISSAWARVLNEAHCIR